MSAGRPLIFGCVGVARSVLSKFKGADVITPDDVSELVRSIRRYMHTGRPAYNPGDRATIEQHFIRENISSAVAMEVLSHADSVEV